MVAGQTFLELKSHEVNFASFKKKTPTFSPSQVALGLLQIFLNC